MEGTSIRRGLWHKTIVITTILEDIFDHHMVVLPAMFSEGVFGMGCVKLCDLHHKKEDLHICISRNITNTCVKSYIISINQ